MVWPAPSGPHLRGPRQLSCTPTARGGLHLAAVPRLGAPVACQPAGLGRTLSRGLGLAEAWAAEGQQPALSHTQLSLMNQWKDEFKAHSRVKCPNSGCWLEFPSIYGLKYHFQRCQGVRGCGLGRGPEPALPQLPGRGRGGPAHACPLYAGCYLRKADLSLSLL